MVPVGCSCSGAISGWWAIICSDIHAFPALLDPGSWRGWQRLGIDGGSADEYGDGQHRNLDREHNKAPADCHQDIHYYVT